MCRTFLRSLTSAQVSVLVKFEKISRFVALELEKGVKGCTREEWDGNNICIHTSHPVVLEKYSDVSCFSSSTPTTSLLPDGDAWKLLLFAPAMKRINIFAAERNGNWVEAHLAPSAGQRGTTAPAPPCSLQAHETRSAEVNICRDFIPKCGRFYIYYSSYLGHSNGFVWFIPVLWSGK